MREEWATMEREERIKEAKLYKVQEEEVQAKSMKWMQFLMMMMWWWSMAQ
jgi:hypothetical protein